MTKRRARMMAFSAMTESGSRRKGGRREQARSVLRLGFAGDHCRTKISTATAPPPCACGSTCESFLDHDHGDGARRLGGARSRLCQLRVRIGGGGGVRGGVASHARKYTDRRAPALDGPVPRSKIHPASCPCVVGTGRGAYPRRLAHARKALGNLASAHQGGAASCGEGRRPGARAVWGGDRVRRWGCREGLEHKARCKLIPVQRCNPRNRSPHPLGGLAPPARRGA
ncbi:hypothetical protein OF83DRAFT_676249 [Amylostereum chailletii]|nr:hypothetical protein OF83DRAFT_676249 [Amylostereum chailletii]